MDSDLELKIRREYSKIFPQLEALSLWVESLLKELCYQDEFIYTFQVRKKNIESLILKVEDHQEGSINTFEEVVEKIHDLVASRIMVYVPAKIKDVHDIIMNLDRVEVINIKFHTYENSEINNIAIIEKIVKDLETKGTRFKRVSNKTGYFGVHYILRPKLANDFYSNSTSSKPFDKFELQLRTLMNHAWSEVQHKIIYKSRSQHDYNHEFGQSRFADLASFMYLCDCRLEGLAQHVFATPSVEPSKTELSHYDKHFQPFHTEISQLIEVFEKNELPISEFQIKATALLDKFKNDVQDLSQKTHLRACLYINLELAELYLKSDEPVKAYNLYQALNQIPGLQQNTKFKILLRLGETFLRLKETCESRDYEGYVQKAEDNIQELEETFVSLNDATRAEDYPFYHGAAMLSWKLEKYELAVIFGDTALKVYQNDAEVENSPRFKLILNSVYYHLESWKATHNDDNFLSLKTLITELRPKVDEVIELLNSGRVQLNASLYDTLAWYYFHVAITARQFRNHQEAQEAISTAKEYSEQCILSWYQRRNICEITPHSVWREHSDSILNFSIS